MDAREKWQRRAYELALVAGNYATQHYTHDNLKAHLRTTPEGFALVPVPEWVLVGEQWPEDGTPVFWCFKDGRYVLDGTFFSRSADIYHEFFSHWMIRKHDKPAPPKSEPL